VKKPVGPERSKTVRGVTCKKTTVSFVAGKTIA
jgi:hypothetical protein